MDSNNPDMDSTNPYSQYRSYVGLLNSQREKVVHQNFSYESFPSSANLGSSEIPLLSSQQSEAPAVPEDTLAERRERKKWSPADDEVLISAWLNTSKDAVVGNEQKSRNFWKRVGQYYALMPYRVVMRALITIVSRGGQRSTTWRTSSVEHTQLQRDKSPADRMRTTF